VQTFPENVQLKEMVDIFLKPDFENAKISDLHVLEYPFPESNSPFNLTPRSNESESPKKSTFTPKLNLPLLNPVQLPIERPYSSSRNDIENQNENSLKRRKQYGIIPNLQLTLNLVVTAATFKIDNFYGKEIDNLELIKEIPSNFDFYTYESETLNIIEKIEQMLSRKQKQLADICYEGNIKTNAIINYVGYTVTKMYLIS
jgi:hypothetical protein